MSVMYIHPSLYVPTSLQMERNHGVHQNVMSPAGPLLLCTVKGGRPRLGGERVAISQVGDSFWGQIGREAVARMSGRHWMNIIY